MMPVNILPSFPTLSSNKPTAKALVNGETLGIEKRDSRPSSPSPSANPISSNPLRPVTPLPVEAPTTVLAAKVALMTSKLENIRSLFSIEVALSLVHHAKASLERAAQFRQLAGPIRPSGKTAVFHHLCNAPPYSRHAPRQSRLRQSRLSPELLQSPSSGGRHGQQFASRTRPRCCPPDHLLGARQRWRPHPTDA